MLLVLPEFELHNATSLAEACALLSRYGEDAQLLAGGTDLLPKMKHKRLVVRHLVNIKTVPGLDRIRYGEDDGLCIGALATMEMLKDSPAVARVCPGLGMAAKLLGTSQIRNLATLGGNLANASPSAECAPALLTHGARLQCVGPNGAREIPLERFFVAPGKTALRRDEILTEIRLPASPLRGTGAYFKHSLRMMDVAMVGVAVAVHLDGDLCREARIALGAVAPVPFRATKAEAVLDGQNLANREVREQAARTAARESLPIDDLRAYASYRRKIVETLVGRGLDHVVGQAARELSGSEP